MAEKIGLAGLSECEIGDVLDVAMVIMFEAGAMAGLQLSGEDDDEIIAAAMDAVFCYAKDVMKAIPSSGAVNTEEIVLGCSMTIGRYVDFLAQQKDVQ